MKTRCSHDYEIIKEHEMPSPADKYNGSLSASNLPLSFFVSKYIIVYKCKKCNEIKESVFINPEE